MNTSAFSRTWLIGSVAAASLAALSGTALAQAQSFPHMSDCLAPSSALNQQCVTERQPNYTTESSQPLYKSQSGPSGPIELRDNRPVMSLDNGGGGSQSPVVPNTTGAPATTGASPTWD
jgi:hypothetical protein